MVQLSVISLFALGITNVSELSPSYGMFKIWDLLFGNHELEPLNNLLNQIHFF